jgi:hypothetical protein
VILLQLCDRCVATGEGEKKPFLHDSVSGAFFVPIALLQVAVIITF